MLCGLSLGVGVFFTKSAGAKGTTDSTEIKPLKTLILDSIFGIAACFSLAVATSSLFVSSWGIFAAGISGVTLFGSLLIIRYRPGSNE